MNVLISYFHFIWIPCSGSTAIINIAVQGTTLNLFRRHNDNVTSIYVRCWRLQSAPALKGLTFTSLGTQRRCNVEWTSMTSIQSRNNVVCPVGYGVAMNVEYKLLLLYLLYDLNNMF